MSMNNLVIINNECFRDTDIPLALLLAKKYTVDYYIILDSNSKINKADIIKSLAENKNVSVHVVNGQYRRREIGYCLLMRKVFKQIKQTNPVCLLTAIKDDIFCNIYLSTFFRGKLLYMSHDVERHPVSGFSMSDYVGRCLDSLMMRSTHRFLLFSYEQYALFKKLYPHKEANYILKPIHNFGESTLEKPQIEEVCNFLFLGGIAYHKGLDILIDAFEKVLAETNKKITLSVYGRGYNDEWRTHIKTKEAYNLHIGFFDDADVPDIFKTHHFLVLPYRQVTQSGPFSIALGYGLPVVASNIGIFGNSITDGENGILFEKENVDDLAQCIKQCAVMNTVEYNKMSEAVLQLRYKMYDDAMALAKVEGLISSAPVSQ